MAGGIVLVACAWQDLIGAHQWHTWPVERQTSKLGVFVRVGDHPELLTVDLSVIYSPRICISSEGTQQSRHRAAISCAVACLPAWSGVHYQAHEPGSMPGLVGFRFVASFWIHLG